MELPDKLVKELKAARRVTVLTGAGVSAESGVPTFRDALTGLWEKFDPQELATPRAFARNPKLVWDWYDYRRKLVSDAQPNPAHMALAEIEKLFPEFTLITQNVDGLHQRAGSSRVIELHGNIARTKCASEGTIVTEWEETAETPPRCPQCGSYLRPDVVWFEESLPESELESAIRASQTCDLFLCIGTSAMVYPAAQLPREALARVASVVEINPEPTPLSDDATYVLTGAAGKIVPGLLEAVRTGPR